MVLWWRGRGVELCCIVVARTWSDVVCFCVHYIQITLLSVPLPGINNAAVVTVYELSSISMACPDKLCMLSQFDNTMSK